MRMGGPRESQEGGIHRLRRSNYPWLMLNFFSSQLKSLQIETKIFPGLLEEKIGFMGEENRIPNLYRAFEENKRTQLCCCCCTINNLDAMAKQTKPRYLELAFTQIKLLIKSATQKQNAKNPQDWGNI